MTIDREKSPFAHLYKHLAPKPLAPLTATELEALAAYKAKHGRRWKSILCDAWMGKPPHDDTGTLRNLRNSHGPSWLHTFRFPVADDGPWEASVPEGGDGDDTVIICNADHSEYEIIEIRNGTLAKRKSLARRIAALLNEGEGRMM